MRIKIGKYKSWFGPYQVAEALCFWAKDVKDEHGFKSKPEWVHKFGEWLSHGNIEPDPVVGEIRDWGSERHTTWLYKFLLWIDSKKKRTVKVHIDKWDTWNMDYTLALIILPMLEQLKKTKHGSPHVDDEDVPPHLRKGTTYEWDDQLTFDFYKENNEEDLTHKRWEWVLNEMIWAFKEHITDDAEDKFWGDIAEESFKWEYMEDGNYKLLSNDNNKSNYDQEGWKSWNEKKQNGFRLFGKYYTGLWD